MSILLYNLFLWFYAAGIRLVAPWNRKAARWLSGRKGLFDRIQQFRGQHGGKLIWMHCASLGEFEQGRPLLEAARAHYPDYTLVLSFFSPSGYEVRKNYPGVDFVCYLPMDSPANAHRFLDLMKPALVFWVKYEYWYYYLTEIHKRQIPLLLVSAQFRAGQPFFRNYGKLHRSMLDCFTGIFVQTDISRSLLASIGLLERVVVSGDTRFDRVLEIAAAFDPIEGVGAFCGSDPVIVAGSTWEEDEEELDHYANTHPGTRFIIAPHEVEEVRLKEVEALFHDSIRYSDWLKSPDPLVTRAHVLIIDNIGLLSRLYKYASIAYVGGGFGEDGVHNVLEAAVFGKPVLMGPEIEKFTEAVELVESGGGIIVESALEAEKAFKRLFEDGALYTASCQASENFVHSRQGATRKILLYIQENRLLTT